MTAVLKPGMDRIERNKVFIETLANSKSPKQRVILIQLANRDQILTLSEIFANFLHGTIDLSNTGNFKSYKRNKRLFRVIGFKGRKSWLERKKAAKQLGRVLVKFLKDVLKVL